MAEFSIIDTYFHRHSDSSEQDLGIGDDSALLTPPPINNWSFVLIPWLQVDIFHSTQTHTPLAGKVLRLICRILQQWGQNHTVFYWH